MVASADYHEIKAHNYVSVANSTYPVFETGSWETQFSFCLLIRSPSMVKLIPDVAYLSCQQHSRNHVHVLISGQMCHVFNSANALNCLMHFSSHWWAILTLKLAKVRDKPL